MPIWTNDGDLDLVINNLEDTASILSQQFLLAVNQLTLKLKGQGKYWPQTEVRFPLYIMMVYRFRSTNTVRGLFVICNAYFILGLGSVHAAGTVVWCHGPMDQLPKAWIK